MNKIAKELIEISKLLIALDCPKFEQDFATLLKQYHTMHGPSKRSIKKTLDIMETRLRDECSEKKNVGTQFEKDWGKNPDDFWHKRSSHKIVTFMYFTRGGKLFEDRGTHLDLFHKVFPNLKPRWFGKEQLEDAYDAMIDLMGKMSEEKAEELFDAFPNAGSIYDNWDEFQKFMSHGYGKYYGKKIKSILIGNWGDYDEVVLGRASQEFDDETWAVSFWGKPSKAVMKRVAAKLSVDVKTIYLWN